MSLEERAIKTMPMAADYYLANRLFLLLRFSRWDEVLAERQSDKSLLITGAFHHYARALAFAGKRDQSKALEEQKAFMAARAAIPSGTMFMFNRAEKVMEVATRVLEGRRPRHLAAIRRVLNAILNSPETAFDRFHSKLALILLFLRFIPWGMFEEV